MTVAIYEQRGGIHRPHRSPSDGFLSRYCKRYDEDISVRRSNRGRSMPK
jgi:hypothetical protein